MEPSIIFIVPEIVLTLTSRITKQEKNLLLLELYELLHY